MTFVIFPLPSRQVLTSQFVCVIVFVITVFDELELQHKCIELWFRFLFNIMQNCL